MHRNVSAFVVVVSLAVANQVYAVADFSVTSEATRTLDSAIAHVNYVKQWTLTATDANDGDDKIDSLNLDLSGRVFVSYVSGIASGVLGYVNVTGDSQEVVEVVSVRTNDDDDEQLHVRIDNTSSNSSVNGYLLTEIFLSASSSVTDVKSQRSAEVVIQDGVLVASGTDEELQLELSRSSSVYVSSDGTAVSLGQLKLEVSDTASLQFNVDSVTVSGDAKLEAHDSASITVLASSFKAEKLELDAEDSGTICIAAADVTTSSYDGEDASKISMPDSSNKYDSTGNFACEELSVPAREPKCMSSSCSSSSTTTNASGSSIAAADESTSSSTSGAGLRYAALGFEAALVAGLSLAGML
ncbi:hypothetical protein BBJ28_00025427 [Nothophytophthora sp. Chile5]|nr:hypothetical protein BBJ28_00025427 [Nothophytophthora sp. Chile5]